MENIEKDIEKIKQLEKNLKSLREKTYKKLELTPSKDGIRTGIRKNNNPYTVRTNRDRFFYPKEWMKFYDILRDYQKPIYHFLINTGARINEARNVRVNDIDIDNKRIILRVTKVKSKGGEKNPRPRIIPISSQFAKWLKSHIKKYKLQSNDYLKFQSAPAVHISMKKTLKKAEIKDWYMFSTHNIRKTFENYLMAMGIDGLKIVAHLGHSMNVASKHYISPDIFSYEEKKDMRLILGDLYSI